MGQSKHKMETESEQIEDMNVVPDELTEGCFDISADQDGGIKKVFLGG